MQFVQLYHRHRRRGFDKGAHRPLPALAHGCDRVAERSYAAPQSLSNLDRISISQSRGVFLAEISSRKQTLRFISIQIKDAHRFARGIAKLSRNQQRREMIARWHVPFAGANEDS